MLSSAINFVRFATISFRISYASRTRLHPVGEPKSFFFGCLLTQNTFFLIEAYIMLARGSLNSYFNGFEIHLLCDRIVPNKKLKKKELFVITCRRCRSVCKRGGAAPCLLFPHHQCTSDCLEAEGFHQKLVLASVSHSPAVAGGSISGPNLFSFKRERV